MQVALFCPNKKKPLQSSPVLHPGKWSTVELSQEELSYFFSCAGQAVLLWKAQRPGKLTTQNTHTGTTTVQFQDQQP